jgi:hypothetical protein
MYGTGLQNMQTSYGSQVENGQLVPTVMGGQVQPSQAYIPYFNGRGAPTPTLPPPIQIGGSHNSWAGGMGLSSNAAAEDPWNIFESPVIWAIAFLVIGILGLRHIHWRG